MNFTDQFPGPANDSLGANWDENEDFATAFRLDGNNLVAIRGAQTPAGQATIQGRAFVVPGPWGNDQYAELEYFSSSTGRSATGVCVRGSGTRLLFTGYGLLVRPFTTSLELRRYVNDQVRIGVVLASSAVFSLVQGERLGLRVDGTRLRAYRNRVIIPGFDIVDATVAAGTPGMLNGAADIVSDGTGHRTSWDNYLATDAPSSLLDPKGKLKKFRMGLIYGTRIRTRSVG